MIVAGLFKRAPWEPQCFYPDFSYEISCGDSWGDSKLIVATDSGVYLVEGQLTDFISHTNGYNNALKAYNLPKHKICLDNNSKIRVPCRKTVGESTVHILQEA